MDRIKKYQKQVKQHKGKNAPARECAYREAERKKINSREKGNKK